MVRLAFNKAVRHVSVSCFESEWEAISKMGLTPPTKMVFRLSMAIWLFALLLYILGVFNAFGGGFAGVAIFCYWLAMISWAVLAAGVALKGV